MIDRESGRNKERKRILQIRHPPLGEQSQRQTALYHLRSRNDRTQSSRSSIRQKNDRVLLFISTRFRGNKWRFRETGYAIAAEHLVRTRGQRSRPRGFWLEVERVDSPARTALAPSAYRAQSTRDVDARAHRSSYTVAIDLELVILVAYHSSFALLLCDLSISKSVYRFHCFEQLYFTPTISTIVVAKFRNFVKERKEGRVFDGKIKSSIADWFTFGRRVSPTSKFARAIYWQFFKSN